MTPEIKQNKLVQVIECKLTTYFPLHASFKLTPEGDFYPIYVDDLSFLPQAMQEAVELISGFEPRINNLYIRIKGDNLTIDSHE